MNEAEDLANAAHANIRTFIFEANRAAVSLSKATLKGLLLINGGAAVSMLGFVASVASKDKPLHVDLVAVTFALQWFSWGVAASVLATGLAYITMFLQAGQAQSVEFHMDAPYLRNGRHSRKYLAAANTVQFGSVLTATCSLAFFLEGTLAVARLVGSQ